MNCLNCEKELVGWQLKFCSKKCGMAYWAKGNSEKTKAAQKRWIEKNPEKVSARYKAKYDERKAYHKEYVVRNKEKINAYHKEYTSTHPRKDTRKAAERKIHIKQQQNRRKQLLHTLTADQWRSALDYFNNCCAYCGEKLSKAHMEHFIPARLGGGLTKENIVPACETCNKKKSGKNPLDWLVMQAHGLAAYLRVKQYLDV